MSVTGDMWLEDGAVIGRGTHDDLMAAQGAYYEMVKASEEDAAAVI